MPVIDMFATTENQSSSHRGTCFEAERPEAFDTAPTSAVTKKWQPVNVVAAKKWIKVLRSWMLSCFIILKPPTKNTRENIEINKNPNDKLQYSYGEFCDIKKYADPLYITCLFNAKFWHGLLLHLTYITWKD